MIRDEGKARGEEKSCNRVREGWTGNWFKKVAKQQ